MEKEIPEKEKNDEMESVFEVDQKDYSKYLSYCKSKENLVMAIIGGAIVSVVVIALWPVLVKLTGYKVGWMVLIQGFASGYAVKKLGKGISPGFGILAGIMTFLTWLAGNLLTACVIFSRIKNVSFFSILSNMDVPSAFDFLKAFLGPIDFLIGIAAVYAAYYLGYRRLQPPQ
jgi:hypothetical protein